MTLNHTYKRSNRFCLRVVTLNKFAKVRSIPGNLAMLYRESPDTWSGNKNYFFKKNIIICYDIYILSV